MSEVEVNFPFLNVALVVLSSPNCTQMSLLKSFDRLIQSFLLVVVLGKSIEEIHVEEVTAHIA